MGFDSGPARWLRFMGALAAIVLLVVTSTQTAPQPRPRPGGAEPPFSVPLLPTSVTRSPAGKGVPRGAATVDLAAFGYVEEEFLVTGKANVYQYDPTGAVVVKTPDVGYTTRILVRRPAKVDRFTGTVQVETSHPQYGIDFVWSRTTDYVLTNGDVFVSIATRRGEPSAIEAMTRFDPVRYAPLNFHRGWPQLGRHRSGRTVAQDPDSG